MSATKRELLEKLKSKIKPILHGRTTADYFGCDPSDIHEICVLMGTFQSLDLEQRTLKSRFDRYDSLKQHEKKKFAWARVTDSLYRINVMLEYEGQSLKRAGAESNTSPDNS
jgi:hypothetical protein